MNGGILYIDKPSGCTSRDVDNALQRLFRTRRVGHLGTLDPFATGLLIVAVGEATKCLPFYADEEKTYRAKLRLGQSTLTGDYTGEVKEEGPIPALEEMKVQEVLASFLGEYMQVPPMTSATRIDGKHLYELAHKGLEVERVAKKRYVHEIELLSLEGDSLEFFVTVSKGTYIRTLGEDIASRLGTVGHLVSLRRIKVGKTDVKEAIPLEEVQADALRDPYALLPYKKVLLSKEDSEKVKNGVKLSLPYEEERLFLCDQTGKGLAIYEKEGALYRALRGLA